MNNICIPYGTTNYEYYNVPDEVIEALITILSECSNIKTKIVAAESER
jgi:hypothetical protein